MSTYISKRNDKGNGYEKEVCEHIKIICNDDPRLSFKGVSNKKILGQNKLLKINYQATAEAENKRLLSIGRILLNYVINFISVFQDVLIFPGHPDDDLPTGITSFIPVNAQKLREIGGLTYEMIDDDSNEKIFVVTYDVSDRPYKKLGVEVPARKYFVKAKNGNCLLLARVEMLFHELSHLEFQFDRNDYYPDFDNLESSQKYLLHEKYAIQRENKFRFTILGVENDGYTRTENEEGIEIRVVGFNDDYYRNLMGWCEQWEQYRDQQ